VDLGDPARDGKPEAAAFLAAADDTVEALADFRALRG